MYNFTFKLNLYNYLDVIFHEIMRFLYKPMKTGFHTKFVQTYEA